MPRIWKSGNGNLRMSLRGPKGFSGYTTIAPVPLPRALKDAGAKADNSQSLDTMREGWCYDDAIQAIIVKSTWGESPASLLVEW